MLIDLSNPKYVIVRREVTDPKFGKDESWFFYRLCLAFKALGYNCIKKLAHKDGHLVDDSMYYIRDRKSRWMVWDSDHAVRLTSQDFDKAGLVKLAISTISLQGGICK